MDFQLAKASRGVAVVLNANAKRVTPRLRQRMEKELAGVDIFYSKSIEDAHTIARQVLERGYHTVLTGGGDGTFIQMINLLYSLTQRIAEAPADTRGELVSLDRARQRASQRRTWMPGDMPALGILRLGTGNAVASVVDAGDCVEDVQKIVSLYAADRNPTTKTIALMESERQVFPFAGLGWDGAVLNDYMGLKEWATGTWAQNLIKTGAGYVAAAFSRTIPRMLFESTPEVEIRTLDDAWLMGPDGQRAKHFSPGQVLYAGPANEVAFGTVPFFGCHFEMFPFARVTDAFQLRVLSAGIPEVVANLPLAWMGKYRSSGLMDFHARRIRIDASRPMPYEVGGDAQGDRECLEVGMSSYPLDMVDYHSPGSHGSLLDSVLPALRSAGDGF